MYVLSWLASLQPAPTEHAELRSILRSSINKQVWICAVCSEVFYTIPSFLGLAIKFGSCESSASPFRAPMANLLGRAIEFGRSESSAVLSRVLMVGFQPSRLQYLTYLDVLRVGVCATSIECGGYAMQIDCISHELRPTVFGLPVARHSFVTEL